MQKAPPVSKECAVLFADLVGSTQLYERMGDTAAFALIDRCLRGMRDAVLSCSGRVIKMTGDGLLATFRACDQAADTSLAIHAAISELPLASHFSLGVRTGFHFGPVIETGDDIYGESVNIAARLSELGSHGRAIVSTEAAVRLSEHFQAMVRPMPPRVVKGVARSVEMCELRCEHSDMVTHIGGLNADLGKKEMRVYHGGRVWLVGAEHPRLRLGRDAGVDILVRDARASRQHCEIEFRRDRFVLIDRSSNGTFVTLEGRHEFALTREEVVIDGHGWLAFGSPRSNASDVVEFFCLG
ncbi:adenylate/guanylate cyclase domain-containing protein [Methyloversatilis thermotolerans]|uniref:adenylate/guanylate cyclase domain-containing protein n=1 Tax=Methyloversatilis thermotolerans TaxID=1346290 RepID=UPI00037168E0|nr:adenylate/guanylate cyclase domain-containing protein [Methyloversatilis thermotolerans]